MQADRGQCAVQAEAMQHGRVAEATSGGGGGGGVDAARWWRFRSGRWRRRPRRLVQQALGDAHFGAQCTWAEDLFSAGEQRRLAHRRRQRSLVDGEAVNVNGRTLGWGRWRYDEPYGKLDMARHRELKATL